MGSPRGFFRRGRAPGSCRVGPGVLFQIAYPVSAVGRRLSARGSRMFPASSVSPGEVGVGLAGCSRSRRYVLRPCVLSGALPGRLLSCLSVHLPIRSSARLSRTFPAWIGVAGGAGLRIPVSCGPSVRSYDSARRSVLPESLSSYLTPKPDGRGPYGPPRLI